MLLYALITLPLFFAALAVIIPGYRVRSLLLPVSASIHLALSIYLFLYPPLADARAWIGLDALSMLVLLVTSALFFFCSIYAVDYLRLRKEWGHRVMVVCQLIFLSTMTLAVCARHLGVLWFAVEATTFVSAPMIYFNRNPLSIEATWKYLINSSVSVALAMLGILFIAYARVSGGNPADLQLDVLLSQGGLLENNWIRAGFVFYAVGFATKMGLAPVHMWKPDAYGEAPGLVGALMAGGLTIVAFLAMLRGVQVMDAAGEGGLAHSILLGFGLLSVAIAAISLVKQPDIKRLLAYSSIEHVGILSIGIGVGGLATFGALLHLINNSLSKGSMFLIAGNLHRSFGSKRLPEISGAMSALPVSGRLFMGGFIAIAGTPPFGLFVSEWLIICGMFQKGFTVPAIVLLVSLGVAFAGLSQTALMACMGEKPAAPVQHRDRFMLVVPPLAMLIIVLMLGVYIPEPINTLLSQAAALIEVTP